MADFWGQFQPVDPNYYNNPANGGGFAGQMTGMPTGTAPAAGGDTSMSAFSQAWLASPYPGTVDGLKQFVAANPQYGVTLGGSKGDKVYGPGGQYWGDAVIAAGDNGGRGKSRLSGETGGGGPMGSLLAPFTGQYNLPSQAELEAMPGYQAALAASNEATQRSAAARGTLLTGGTQRGLQENAGKVASQMYGQLAGLGLGAFQTNRDTFYHNQDSPFNKLFQTSQLGLNASSQPTVGPTLQQTQTSYTTPGAPTPLTNANSYVNKAGVRIAR